MTNYKEEQELELEALTSIFEEGKELEKVSDTEFKLKFKPFPNDEGENHVSVTLRITYTDTYPETAPDWELQDAVMADDKLEELKSKIEESIESNLGMAMVYTISEMCQEWLKENNVKELSMHEQMMKRMGGDEEDEGGDEDEDIDDEEINRLEEEEWKGLASKPEVPEKDRITVESFNDWKKKFDAEMIALGTLKREENRGQSGKQFFLAMQASEGDTEKKDDAPLVYNAALFGEEDDDLDDLSGGEDDEEKEKSSGYPG